VIAAAEAAGHHDPALLLSPGPGIGGGLPGLRREAFLDGPVKGIQMSCMIDARDGMVVSTTDAEAVDFAARHRMAHAQPSPRLSGLRRRRALPAAGHDRSGGHGLRRYRGLKRTHNDQDLGPLVQHEMNRCIQCYRCRATTRSLPATDDLGVMGIGSRVYFGRFAPGPGKPLCRQPDRHLPHRGLHRQTLPLFRAALGFQRPRHLHALFPGLQPDGIGPLP
jgi:NADH-quinone oxidoreductase subunit G